MTWNKNKNKWFKKKSGKKRAKKMCWESNKELTKKKWLKYEKHQKVIIIIKKRYQQNDDEKQWKSGEKVG